VLISHAETNFDYDPSLRILVVNVDFLLDVNYRRLEISTELIDTYYLFLVSLLVTLLEKTQEESWLLEKILLDLLTH